ncbi:serine/threonine-protein kinase [Streptomyces inhibens]|uniref:serine/threonine-protein kinase n=1 Tax=Streptomyces inhibens TaxID=2293571 RepID=UPI0015F28171|nr:serine/threonine-protein kinase [Streptomyces inhibens]
MIGGRYRLESVLGGGGFGRVWKARDETLDVGVAVKEVWLPPATSEEEHAQRLQRAEREARNAARLRSHPHIVAVHDVVIEDQAPWIVMELVEGANLAEKVSQDGPMPVTAVALVAKGLLDGLGAAHEAGIVHRDVKPANVMVTRGGRVLLADFGIAVQQGDTSLTASGGLIGSLEYMPPERFNGVDSGGAGDLYSLGVTLYQALEGVSPFHRETPTETLTAVLLGEVPVPRDAGKLGALITRLLDKDPGNRPTAAEALAVIDTLVLSPVPDVPGAAAGPDSAPAPKPLPDASQARAGLDAVPAPEAPGGAEVGAEPVQAPAPPPAPGGSEALTERVPPLPPTLEAQPPAGTIRPTTGPGAVRPARPLVLVGAAVVAAVAVAVGIAVATSGGEDASPNAGSPRTPAGSTAPAAEQSDDTGPKTPAGCEDQATIGEKWNRIVASDHFGNGTAPIEDLLGQIQDAQRADIAKADRSAVKTALQKDIDVAAKALDALRDKDDSAFNKSLMDRPRVGLDILDACIPVQS